MKTQAKRYNSGKPELHYLDVWGDALGEVCQVCMKGAEKYERGNYLLGQPYSQLLSAAYRHISKFGDYRRPDHDDESGRHHIAHAIWNLLQLLQHETQPNPVIADGRNAWDDRLRPPGWDVEEPMELGTDRDPLLFRGNPPPIEVTHLGSKEREFLTYGPGSLLRDDEIMEQRTVDLETQAKRSNAGYPAHVIESRLDQQEQLDDPGFFKAEGDQ